MNYCQYDNNECPPKHRSGKDTRNWCRGKVGVKHLVEWRKRGYYSPRLTCINCGKEMYWFIGLWRRTGESEEEFANRKAIEIPKQKAEAKARSSYYLDFVEDTP